MKNWGGGYVTDIEYTEGFYPEQSPQYLALAAAFNGFEPPDISRRFTYCELGCGKGLTSLILAASNPGAEFHAVDFNPAHIARAEAQARAAQLDNIRFHETGFEELSRGKGPELPMFDFVTMHGVWSWIAPELQNAIVAFLQRRLKPGGLVHVSYNVMPHWGPIAPLQRILRELASPAPGASDVAMQNAFAVLERLTQAKVIPPSLHDAVKQITHGQRPEHVMTYLVHEYLNEHWRPTYHVDVVRAFSAAKLNYACRADLLRSFSNLVVTEAQQAVLADIPSPELRETLQDFAADTGLRSDLFVRGARQISPSRRDAYLAPLRLALVRPALPVIEIPAPDKTLWSADPDTYRQFVRALEQGPRTVAELLSLPGLPRTHTVTPAELVGIFVGTALALPYQEPSPAAKAACARLNALVEAQGEIFFLANTTIAAASLHTGIGLTSADFDVYMALRSGEPNPEMLASRFMARCKAIGWKPVVDGKSFATDAEAYRELAADYAKKLALLAPVWSRAGII